MPSISASTFKSLANSTFTEIHLTRNKIKTIQNDSFRELNTLEILDLSWIEISGSPNFLCSCNRSVRYFLNLTSLDISYNLIREFNAEEWNCLNMLRKLSLSGNIIESIPENVFSGLTKLKVLFVYGMQFSLKYIHPQGVY